MAKEQIPVLRVRITPINVKVICPGCSTLFYYPPRNYELSFYILLAIQLMEKSRDKKIKVVAPMDCHSIFNELRQLLGYEGVGWSVTKVPDSEINKSNKNEYYNCYMERLIK